MLLVIGTLLAVLAGMLLIRVVWRARTSGDYGTLFAVLAAGLVLGLAVLAATGRLHWIAAVAAAFVPFLRRIGGLLRYLPLVQRLFGTYQGRARQSGSGGPAGNGAGRNPGVSVMNRDRALEILGLGLRPTRAEVIAAHRRLIQKLHPDRGGTNFLAQQLNDAKKVLLDELKSD